MQTGFYMFIKRAAAFSQLNNYESSITDSLAALAIDPLYVKAYSRLGLAYFNLGKYSEAIETYEKGLEIEPGNQVIQQTLQSAKEKVEVSEPADSTKPKIPGMPNMDLGSMMNNPNFMDMASKMMQNPGFASMYF